MLILISYDVAINAFGAKRLRKVAKICMNYGQRVQNSVFECLLSEAQFVIVKHNLEDIIDSDKDNIRFYFIGDNWQGKVIEIGKKNSYDPSSELII